MRPLFKILSRLRIAYLQERYPDPSRNSPLLIKQGLLSLGLSLALLNLPTSLADMESMSRITRDGEPRPQWMSLFLDTALSLDSLFYALGVILLFLAARSLYKFGDSSERRDNWAAANLEIEKLRGESSPSGRAID